MNNKENRLTIDYGGTWVRLVLTNAKNKKIQRLKVPSLPLGQISRLVQSSLNKWKVDQLVQLKIGAKGVWKKKDKRMLFLKLKNLAKKVIVLSDVEMAYENTFGAKPGILLIAGTGSIAYGKNASGQRARAGGLGPKKGDEGSGYWIGKEFLKTRSNKDLDDKSVREIAALAENIIKRAKKKEVLPCKIVFEAINHLAALVLNVSQKLNFKGQIHISLQGGLFKSQFFLKRLLKIL